MKYFIVYILLLLNLILYVKSDLTLNIIQNDTKFTITGPPDVKLYIAYNFTFSINNIYQDESIFSSLNENQLVLSLPSSYCGNTTFKIKVSNLTLSNVINLNPIFYQSDYPFTNNGSSLVVTYYYSNCLFKMKGVENPKVNGDKVSSCTINNNSSLIKCILPPGTGYKNFTANITSYSGSYRSIDMKIRYANVIISDQKLIFNPNDNTTGTVIYYGYNFGNTNDCKIRFERVNITINCNTTSSNTLTFDIGGEENGIKKTFTSLRGPTTITIDGLKSKSYFIMCKIISYDRNASKLSTNGGYMIFKGQYFKEAEDTTKGVEPLTSVIKARLVNPLYRYICSVNITGKNYDTLNVSIPNGIGSGTLYLYYESIYFMQTPMNYTVTYTSSNDSNRMTINIVYTVIIVMGFFTILFFIIHNVKSITLKFNQNPDSKTTTTTDNNNDNDNDNNNNNNT